MTSQKTCYWAFDSFCNKINFLYSCKVPFWSLRFRQFGVCQVNTAQNSRLFHSCNLNKWAKFSTKMFAHFRDIVIFVLGYLINWLTSYSCPGKQTFTTIFPFYVFRFQVRRRYRTDGRTDRQTDGQHPFCGLLRRCIITKQVVTTWMGDCKNKNSFSM